MSCQYIQLAIKFSSSLSQNIGWTVFLRVDGLAYWFLGFETVIGNGTFNGTFPPGVPTTATGGAVNFTNIVVTPTQTVVVAQAGPMQVNLTFLNPIEVRFHYDTFDILRIRHLKPGDWVKQSIPFSYMAFTASSLDGASHAVQVYSDVSGGTCDRPAKLVASLQLSCRVEFGGS